MLRKTRKKQKKPPRDLEQELKNNQSIITKVCTNLVYAQRLYAALCNVAWYTNNSKESWTCTWRSAGGIVSDLRGTFEDYLVFYCSGIGGNGTPEGVVHPDIAADLAEMGWQWKHIIN